MSNLRALEMICIKMYTEALQKAFDAANPISKQAHLNVHQTANAEALSKVCTNSILLQRTHKTHYQYINNNVCILFVSSRTNESLAVTKSSKLFKLNLKMILMSSSWNSTFKMIMRAKSLRYVQVSPNQIFDSYFILFLILK